MHHMMVVGGACITWWWEAWHASHDGGRRGMHHMMVGAWHASLEGRRQGKVQEDSLPCTSRPLCGELNGTRLQGAGIAGPAEPTCTSEGNYACTYVHVM